MSEEQKLEQIRDQARRITHQRRELDSLRRDAYRLRAENEALRRDAERYEWLRVNAYVEVRCDSPRIDGWTPEQLDAAIDAERSK